MRTARNGHDEFWKFLGPYGWSRGYMGADGKPVQPGLIPTLEESMEQRTILVGTAEEVAADRCRMYRDLLGSSTSRCSRTSSATRTRRPSSRWTAS